MELLIEVLVDVPKGIHAFILFLEVVLEVFVVLLQVLVLHLQLLHPVLQRLVLSFSLFHGFV